MVTVSKGSKSFDVQVSWTGSNSDLDLHLVSPSGRHYGWYGDTTGFSGVRTNPQEFRIPRPEAGIWRVSVQAVRGGLEPTEFGVATSGQKTAPPAAAQAFAPVLR